MPVPTDLDDLSTTAADNDPQGTENVFPSLDDHLRQIYAFIAQVYAIISDVETVDHQVVYSQREAAHSGLTWGYNGGRWGGFSISDGTLTLTDETTNYLVVARATGVISTSATATNWNDLTNYARVYRITTFNGQVTNNGGSDFDYRAGPGGVHGQPGTTALRGLQFTSDTDSTADSDPGSGVFKWNGAQGSATKLFIDNSTSDGVSLTSLWSALGQSGRLYIQQSDDPTRWQQWTFTAHTDDSGYRDFSVTLEAKSANDIQDAKVCFIDLDEGSGSASQTQTGEMLSGFIASPSNKDYRIVVKAAHGGTITETTTISASGTCTATFKINTTALGGTANSVSSSEQSQSHASANTFSAGDDIVITVSSNSSCADMSFTIKYTRTLS